MPRTKRARHRAVAGTTLASPLMPGRGDRMQLERREFITLLGGAAARRRGR